ncbi:palmitoyltransferase swf1 [Anaeramoeba flamelloides]|uniref:Palmitoyltransferase n=1 Tax=Anaeramoeba flamelloides TaxID=1746091 RepID=A0ABQ8YWA6_9EUKA|nr:palmitoyltransferase swf1 [Anaeramoeba flamelloides]
MLYEIFLAIYLPTITFVVFVLLFGPNEKFRDGFLGDAHEFITSTLWTKLRNLITRVCGESAGKGLGSIGDYLFYSRNPLILIFYLAILFGGMAVFFLYVWPHLEETPTLHPIHLVLIPLCLLFVFSTFLASALTDPGKVTKGNLDRYLKLYPYDYQLFYPYECYTCKFAKPARSKHCRILKCCIAKYDHYCAWLMNSIGEKNYRWFLLYLYSNFLMCVYGTWIIYKILEHQVDASGMFTNTYYDQAGNVVQIGYPYMIRWLLEYFRIPIGLSMMTFLMSIVVFCFICYHLYLISKNITTNESSKFSVLKYYITQKKLEIDNYQKALQSVNQSKNVPKKRSNKKKSSKKKQNQKKKLKNYQKNRNELKKLKKPIITPMDKIVLKLDPENLKSFYNKGFWTNLKQVFFPISIYGTE